MKVKAKQVKNLIETIPNGTFWSVTFKKSDGTVRKATVQKGVFNPKNPLKKPKGTGISQKESLKNGVVKFYEPHHKNTDGTVTGEYRSCRIDRIISFSHPKDKEIYIVEE